MFRDKRADVICFSHLRWNFVFQRPQHLMTRCARDNRVFFIEEPEYELDAVPHWDIEQSGGVATATPHLPIGLGEDQSLAAQRRLVDELIHTYRIHDFVAWYYTPMALAYSDHLRPAAVVYDCMDELSAFKGAAPALKQREAELMQRATLVLTGGQSLYEAKRDQHSNIHPFPSSVDAAHFGRARMINE